MVNNGGLPMNRRGFLKGLTTTSVATGLAVVHGKVDAVEISTSQSGELGLSDRLRLSHRPQGIVIISWKPYEDDLHEYYAVMLNHSGMKRRELTKNTFFVVDHSCHDLYMPMETHDDTVNVESVVSSTKPIVINKVNITESDLYYNEVRDAIKAGASTVRIERSLEWRLDVS